jgi:methylthioxylose transferase
MITQDRDVHHSAAGRPRIVLPTSHRKLPGMPSGPGSSVAGGRRAEGRDGPVGRPEIVDLLLWTALVAVGLGLTLLAVRLDAPLGTASAPFLGSYRLALDPATLLAPTVALVALIAVANGVHERLRWPLLLFAGYGVAAAWAFALAVVDGGQGLAGPMTNPDEYLADVPDVAGDPGRYLDTFVQREDEHTVATRQHPPLPVLALWALTRLGIERPAALGATITVLGALVTPLVAAAVRSLCGEQAARRLLPVLALAPYAVWIAVSMDAVTAALGAAFVAAGVIASERDRPAPSRVGWAAACGLLLGVAALFTYSVAWLGASVLCIYFVRRRPLLNVATGGCALLPLLAVAMAGFSWADGLEMAQRDLSTRVGPVRSALIWGFLGLVVLLLACGPALVASARKVALTPGWPFLVGAVLGVGFAILAGLARGEAERSWLPFFPWLLVAAVAPERRGGPASPTPVLLVGAGAVTAVTIQAVLRTAW